MAEITLRKITKSYGPTKVIDNLSLSISTGELVTLLGPSGCGKTSTLKVIAGLVAPDAGTVSINGKDFTHTPVNKRNIGMVFQSLALFPHMTVRENVLFGLRRRKVLPQEAEHRMGEALELVRLSAFADRLPAQLSGGQQQRVALARAFVIEPGVMLLDEPLGALDRKLREELQVEIRRLTRRLGITAIFVTHDQEEALILSDRIAVMNRGVIEQIDRPNVIFERPGTPFVADFMGVSNLLPARIVQGDKPGIEIDFGGRVVRLDAAADLPGGSPVKVGLRPESAQVSFAEPSTQDGQIVCRIESAIYQGVLISLEVSPESDPDMRLHVRVPAGNKMGLVQRVNPGDRVWLTWPMDAVLVYPAE